MPVHMVRTVCVTQELNFPKAPDPDRIDTASLRPTRSQRSYLVFLEASIPKLGQLEVCAQGSWLNLVDEAVYCTQELEQAK